MRRITFELCAEDVDVCGLAKQLGADRVELCSALSEGGITPSRGLVRRVMDVAGVAVHTMLRPRGGDFVYTEEEFRVLLGDLRDARELGVSGVVFGFLHRDGTVDVERTLRVVEAAGTLETTFHRALDDAADLGVALETVIGAGCSRVLTSGGEPDVLRGKEALTRLVLQAGDRIAVAAGGGLRLENAVEVAATGAHHFHGSLRRAGAGSVEAEEMAQTEAFARMRAMIELLRTTA